MFLHTYLKEKYCGRIPCWSNTSFTSGSRPPSLDINLVIIAFIPLSASSKLLMKKSRISDMMFVKQKKQSASANSEIKEILYCWPSLSVRLAGYTVHCRHILLYVDKNLSLTSPFLSRIGGKNVIYWTNNLIHSL